ncbi:MAG TPA: outer membrane protein assembly factor BamE [Longimicrobium sp.]|jgi:hypothetical protein
MARTAALIFAVALLAAASPAAAQTISPGMTAAQVRSLLGDPVTVRSAGDWSYLYYLNGCAVRCGSDDVVFIQNDRVVAAVFRTGRRRFAGPVAGVALDGTAGRGDSDAGMVRLDETPERPTQMRVRDGAREEPGRTVIGRPGAARVGGVRLEGGGSGGTTIIRRDDTDPRDDARRGGPPARVGSQDARGRVNDTRPDDRNQLTGTGVDSPDDDVAAVDSARGAPATAVDDARRAREGRVEANTVRRGNTAATADSTLNRARRERERNVTPRTVTRP